MTFKKSMKPHCRATAVPSTRVRAWLLERVLEAGGDPSSVPEPAFHMMRMAQITKFVGLSRPTVYRLMAKGAFPSPVPLLRSPSAEA